MESYIKQWTGLRNGTPGLREEGYPTDCYSKFDSLEEMAASHGSEINEEYYLLVKVDSNKLKEMFEELTFVKMKSENSKELDELKLQIETLTRTVEQLTSNHL